MNQTNQVYTFLFEPNGANPPIMRHDSARYCHHSLLTPRPALCGQSTLCSESEFSRAATFAGTKPGIFECFRRQMEGLCRTSQKGRESGQQKPRRNCLVVLHGYLAARSCKQMKDNHSCCLKVEKSAWSDLGICNARNTPKQNGPQECGFLLGACWWKGTPFQSPICGKPPLPNWPIKSYKRV